MEKPNYKNSYTRRYRRPNSQSQFANDGSAINVHENQEPVENNSIYQRDQTTFHNSDNYSRKPWQKRGTQHHKQYNNHSSRYLSKPTSENEESQYALSQGHYQPYSSYYSGNDSRGHSNRNLSHQYQDSSSHSSRGFIVGGRYMRNNGPISTSAENHIPSHQSKGAYPQYRTTNYGFNIQVNKSALSKTKKVDMKESTTQRERLAQQLEKGECECLVCCECIDVRDYTWNCSTCFHLFHLQCIRKWAYSSADTESDDKWRCPACQNIYEKGKFDYYCFCGKCKNPEVNFHITPHSCGEVCRKQRENKKCPHLCNLLCHPGPCPPCSATVTRSCECGKIQKQVTCSQTNPILCDLGCEKTLNCKSHKCQDLCHAGSCNPCSETVKQNCFCSRQNRVVPCDVSTVNCFSYSCNENCEKKLDCGNHTCTSVCHPGLCQKCSLLPEFISMCPCGKTFLKDLYATGKVDPRTNCIAPIPVCENKCEKVLVCGPKDNPHRCSMPCHPGECDPCPLTTFTKCRCGAHSKEIPCVEILSSSFEFLCGKRCNRRKICGRHKCLNHCCIYQVHLCELVCNKKLTCGNHLCPGTCHGGNCPPCWNVSFDELRCLCGKNVIYPPIPCGKKPPECKEKCTRTHPCNHDVTHTCHSDPTCPPCTAFTEKWCFGHHELRSHIQCFLDGISCGKYCEKPLPCGVHKCKEICHEGHCLKPNTTCTQPCEKLRACEHPCLAPCHEGPCPDRNCKAKIQLACPCGNRKSSITCLEHSNNQRHISATMFASKMQAIKAGESVNLDEIMGKKPKAQKLQCNEECAVLERNKRLAVALQIKNPELSCKPGPPSYSEFLKDEAKKNLKFVTGVYDKFVELVQLAKTSKQKSRSHAFPPMNSTQRRVIHELAQFFGCETQCYDEEPMKNVAITAFRDRSWLPFVSIATVIEREMGLRRGPAPVMAHTTHKPSPQVTQPEKKEKAIDYFDYCG